jgi:hypothetical protein
MIHQQNSRMAKKKPKDGEPSRRHRMGRVREPLALQLVALSERRATDFTEELNRAVRELLEREGLWPLKSEGAEPGPTPS